MNYLSTIQIIQLPAPPITPPAIGFLAIYPKTDNSFYQMDSNGVETNIGAGAINAILQTMQQDRELIKNIVMQLISYGFTITDNDLINLINT